jgi:hypothetical protein
MARTTASDVATIFDTDLDTSDGGPLDTWVEIANDLVDDIAAADTSLTSSRLTHIEKLVAAHFAATQDQRIESASQEGASVTYQGDTGMGFEGTKYGQQALTLDPTGTLAGATKPAASLSAPDVKDTGHESY